MQYFNRPQTIQEMVGPQWPITSSTPLSILFSRKRYHGSAPLFWSSRAPAAIRARRHILCLLCRLRASFAVSLVWRTVFDFGQYVRSPSRILLAGLLAIGRCRNFHRCSRNVFRILLERGPDDVRLACVPQSTRMRSLGGISTVGENFRCRSHSALGCRLRLGDYRWCSRGARTERSSGEISVSVD